MQHLLLVLGELSPADLLLNLLEVLGTDGQHIVVLLGAKEQGQVGELLWEGQFHEVDGLLETEARSLQTCLDYGLSEVVDIL
jgi:hypothetical protein